VFARGADYAAGGVYEEHVEVGRVAGEAEHGCFHVFLVAGKVDEGQYLGGFVADFFGGATVGEVLYLESEIHCLF